MTPLRRYLDAIGEDFSAVWRGGGTEATVRTVAVEKADPRGVIVTCEECGVELAADSPDLRLELTCDGVLLTYCASCWLSEFAD
jgi:hypothetical protein